MAVTSRRKASSIFDHYINECLTDGGNKVERNCAHCNNLIRGKMGVSSNFLTHLRRKHPQEYEELIRSRPHRANPNVNNVSSINLTTTTTTSSSSAPAAMVTGPSPPIHTSSKQSKHALISTLITKMIVSDLLPLRTVEGKGFQELIQMVDPSYVMVSQQQLKQNILPWYMRSAQDKIRASLKQMESFVLTIDVWEINPVQSYLGFSVSFVTDPWQPKTVALACSYIVGYEGFQKIPMLMEELFKAYGIRDHLYCIVEHKQQNHSIGLLGSNEEECEPESDVEDSHLEVNSVPCSKAFVASLSASIREGLIKGLVPYQPVLDMVAQVVAEIRKCPNTTERIFGQMFSSLKTEIKWILHLQLIRCLLNYTPSEDQGGLEILKNNVFPKEHEAVLTEIVTILELFEEAMTMMCGDQWLPISVCLPSFSSLKLHLAARSTGICAHLATSLSAALENNFKKFTSNSLYVCAAILDPRFKLSWCNDSTQCEVYKQILLEEAGKMSVAEPKLTSPTQNATANLSLSNTKLFSSILNNSSSHSSPKTPRLELQSYLKDEHCEDDPFVYWSIKSGIYPSLAKLVKQVLCVPATGTPIQNVFNSASKIVHSEPYSWFSEHFEILLFLKASMSNFELL